MRNDIYENMQRPMVTQKIPDASPSGLAAEASAELLQNFEHILSHDLTRFKRIALRWLRNPEDAEDAVQDAMLSAFRHMARFEGRSQLSTWITAIVVNAIRMQTRRHMGRRMLSLDRSPQEGEWRLPAEPADPGPTQEQILIHRESCEIIEKLTRGLPPAHREVLRMQGEQGLSIKSIAEKLGMPEGTVKTRLARGRAIVARQYRKLTVAKTRVLAWPSDEARGKAPRKRNQEQRLVNA